MAHSPGPPLHWPCLGAPEGRAVAGWGSVSTYNATASRIWGAFTAAPMKPQTPSLPPLYGWSTLSAYVVRTSTLPSPEDRGFHPAESLEAGEGSSGAPQHPEGVAQWLLRGRRHMLLAVRVQTSPRPLASVHESLLLSPGAALLNTRPASCSLYFLITEEPRANIFNF